MEKGLRLHDNVALASSRLILQPRDSNFLNLLFSWVVRGSAQLMREGWNYESRIKGVKRTNGIWEGDREGRTGTFYRRPDCVLAVTRSQPLQEFRVGQKTLLLLLKSHFPQVLCLTGYSEDDFAIGHVTHTPLP